MNISHCLPTRSFCYLVTKISNYQLQITVARYKGPETLTCSLFLIKHLQGADSFFRNITSHQLVKKLSTFHGIWRLITRDTTACCMLLSATRNQPIPSHLSLDLLNNLIPSGLPTKTIMFFCSIHAQCPPF
jgi:hypothetical protein